ncbi:MAG: hydroxyisourate hydrolase [Alphaproteobacteria bacterium]|nr:hydroxyisourate hydrolase [Alphaproteobacteria bacterium]
MAQGISIHCFDVAHGCVAAGMAVELWSSGAAPALIASGAAGGDALVTHAALNGRFEPGPYEFRFSVAAYYRAKGVALPDQHYLDVVPYRFNVDSPDIHYHFPFKMTPWGYSLFLTCGR